MKSFLLFLCLAAAEKLDRTYLPPPGAKFSGGVSGDIQAPFEIPRETYSTTPRPAVNNGVTPDDTQIEIGINRGVPLRPGNVISTDAQRPLDYHHNIYKVPTTTTSYAFTTTTTHPPNEAYETTTGFVNPVTGLPTSPFAFPTTAPGIKNPEAYYQDNQHVQQFPQNIQPGRVPFDGSSQYPATSNSQFIGQNRPNYIQGNKFDRVQNTYPDSLPGSTQRPSFTENGQDLYRPSLPQGTKFDLVENQHPGFQPGFVQKPYYSQHNQQYKENRYPISGVNPENTLSPSNFAPETPSSTNKYGGDLDQGIIYNQNTPFTKENISSVPAYNKENYPDSNLSKYLVTPGKNLQQGLFQPGQGGLVSHQYPISQTDEYGRPVTPKNIITQSFPVASPTSPISDQFPLTTPGSHSSATAISTGSIPTTTPIYPEIGSQIPTEFKTRPERPQSESDRNAVILNYENVITPDGFAYSFDTSNGIHADESGTAVDGVKAKGSYSYIGDDGKLYSVFYTADENGFQPHGDHIPTAPPIPEAIQKVIEQAKNDQEEGISDDGTYDEDKYGHMNYQNGRPQRPNRINVSGNVPEKYYGQTDKQQQYNPHSDSKVSKPSNVYGSIKDEQNQDFEKSPIIYDQRKPNNIVPARRPVNVQLNTDNVAEYSPGALNATDHKIIADLPTTTSINNRKQLGNRFSVQQPGQYFENSENNVSPQQGSESNENVSFATNNQNTQDYDDNHTDFPSNLSLDEHRKYESGTHHEKIPNQPGSLPNDVNTSSLDKFQGQYGSKVRPATSTSRPFDQSNVYDYQDSKIPAYVNKYLPGKSYSLQPVSSPTTSAPITTHLTGSHEHNYNPTSNRPLLETSPIGDISRISDYDSSNSGPVTTKLPSPSLSNQYDYIQRRPQSTTAKPRKNNDFYASDINEPQVSDQIQNINRPVPSHRPGEINKYTIVPTKADSGYQYLPPQRTFEHGSQVPHGFRTSPNRTLSQNGFNFHTTEVAKPFITPDASRDEDTLEDDYDHALENNPQYGQDQASFQPSATRLQTYGNKDSNFNTENYPVNYEGSQRLGQGGRPEYIKESTRAPFATDKFATIGTTRRPVYQQIQTTSRPQQHISTLRPQGGNQYNYGDKVTYVPTSPDSSRARFEGTRPTTGRPEQQSPNRYSGATDQTPGFYPTTTKLPPKSGHFDITPSRSPYQTTYRPMTSITTGIDSDEALGATVKPGRIPSRKPVKSQKQVPSTTYRPAFFPQAVTEKQIEVDNYGRPIPVSEAPYQQGIRLGVPEGFKPSSENSRRPQNGLRPGASYGGPKEQFGSIAPSYNRPGTVSTTEKIIGEDFSGPKQAQKFDPVRGYYY